MAPFADPRDLLFALGFAASLRRVARAAGVTLAAWRLAGRNVLVPVVPGGLVALSSLLAAPDMEPTIRVAASARRLLRLMAPEAAWPEAAQFDRFRQACARLSPSARIRVARLLAPAYGETRALTRPLRRAFLMRLAFAAPSLTPWMRSVGRGPCAPGDRADDRAKVTGTGAPKARSALFLHSAYYNFGYLAKALRARGWDAVSVSTADPAGYPALYTHGHDIVLYDPDPVVMRHKIASFFAQNQERFGVVHFYGVGAASVFYENWDVSPAHHKMPWDFLEWKRRGALIGYSTSGCLDMVSQSSFRSWSAGMCALCPNEHKDAICSDAKNLAWGWKVAALADLISLETDVRLDARLSPNVFHEPLTYALDPQVWRPGLEIPEEFRQERATPDEVLVYHGVGNFETRLREGRNVKGTHAVVSAIEALQAQGAPIRLMFVRQTPNLQNRYFQAQADIIIDQLHYGRYGATAREGMMLGRPVVGAVNAREPFGQPSRCISECPIVHATPDTILDVLAGLARDPARRAAIGAASRAYAQTWWAADVLAERFERVYDHLRATGQVPSFEEVA